MIRLLTHNFGWKLLSLALAVALWYAVVGEPELATFLIVPIQYKNQPRDLEISSDVPERVHLEVRAPSGKLSPVNLSGAAVVLDLGSVRRAGEQTFTINEANTSLPPGVSFYRAVPSELRFQFDHQMPRNRALGILDNAQARALPARDHNLLAHHRPHASQRIEVRVAERLVLASGKGERLAHAATAS